MKMTKQQIIQDLEAFINYFKEETGSIPMALEQAKELIEKMEDVKMNYLIRDREAGNPIDYFSTLEEAERALKEFEEIDKQDGIFEENFYEILTIAEKYIFEEYRDKKGYGSTKVFDDEETAIKTAQAEWNHLNDYDQKTYLNDAAGIFNVSKRDVLISEDGKIVDFDTDYTPIWNALA